ncbi:MAG: hypothetical protein SNJ57_19095, partial [Cyanobacteriota bacterium]
TAKQTIGSKAEILSVASSSGAIKQHFPDLATFPPLQMDKVELRVRAEIAHEVYLCPYNFAPL